MTDKTEGVSTFSREQFFMSISFSILHELVEYKSCLKFRMLSLCFPSFRSYPACSPAVCLFFALMIPQAFIQRRHYFPMLIFVTLNVRISTVMGTRRLTKFQPPQTSKVRFLIMELRVSEPQFFFSPPELCVLHANPWFVRPVLFKHPLLDQCVHLGDLARVSCL